jgi:quercetin dioxygenase-like cupin family protein
MQTRAEQGSNVDEEQRRSRAGARYAMPDGSVYEITVSAAETAGERMEMISTLPPRNVSPPPHVHPRQFNEFEVLEGTAEVMVDGRWRTSRKGETVIVPPGTLHAFRNRSEGAVRLRDVHRPALRFEDYLEHIHRLLTARGVKSRRDPRIAVYLSMLTLEYPDIVLSTRLHERALLKTLATIGRLLGMSTRVDERR